MTVLSRYPQLLVDEQFRRIADELTRRGFLTSGLGSAALLGLAACGSSGHGHGDGSSSHTRRVSSVNGAITVPGQPKRVVSLDSFTMGAMFDLGQDPAGVYSAGEQYVEPQFLAKWRAIPKVSGGTVGGQIEVEKVAALQPDLILGIDASKPPYAQLKQIAPTVILPFSASTTPWKDMASDTATALGRTDQLHALQRTYSSKAAEIKKRYADVLAHTRWDILQGGFTQGQYWLYGPGSPIGGILADAGVQYASGSASVAGSGQQSVSYERIDRLADADALFYYATNSGAPANMGPQLFAEAGFKRLVAVRDKHLYGTIYFLPSCYSDAISALAALAEALSDLQGGDR